MEIKDLISNLKTDYNVNAIRLDLASEVVSKEELFKYRALSIDAELPLTVKIGGCDALTDIYMAKEINADTIIAPMVETSYAAEKFVNNCKQIYDDNFGNINLLINIETFVSFNNLDNILNSQGAEYIKGIVLGRDDMAKSMGIKPEDINSQKMLNVAQKISDIAHLYGKKFIIGGQVRPDAVSFLQSFTNHNLSGYETRRIVFSADTKPSKEGIIMAINFEIEWLKFIQADWNEAIIEKRITELRRSLYEYCS